MPQVIFDFTGVWLATAILFGLLVIWWIVVATAIDSYGWIGMLRIYVLYGLAQTIIWYLAVPVSVREKIMQDYSLWHRSFTKNLDQLVQLFED